jgi:hypothetical protein
MMMMMMMVIIINSNRKASNDNDGYNYVLMDLRWRNWNREKHNIIEIICS